MVSWLNNAIFYEIYPQSFKDTNADGIGDFAGIEEKLQYIKDLGCNAIWMNPCFMSPFGDAGYDVSDFYKTAPRYGTNAELKRIFDKVHKLDMHIFIDLVAGHTSVAHEWFKQSMKAEKNEFTDRYIWTDSVWEEPEGFGNIRGISDRNGTCAVNYFSHQPALNYGFYKPDPTKKWQQSVDDEGPKATLEELKNIMRFWLTMGCDGFRVDMAHSLVKNDENGKGTIALWKKIRKFLDEEFPQAAIISEWGEPDKSIAGGFHMDFLLHIGESHYTDLFRCDEPFFSSRGKGDAYEFVKHYRKLYETTGKKGLICIPSGNHDIDRLARRLSWEEMKIAFAFLLSMPGAPFIYYGDEIGMRYIENLTSVEGGFERTGSRSPMQWDSGVNAGFSEAPKELLYIPIDESEDRPNVSAQMNDKNSLYNEVKKLNEIRSKHSALQSFGDIDFVYSQKNKYPLAYVRSSADESILVIINPSEKAVKIPFDKALKSVIYSNGGEVCVTDNELTIPGKFAGYFSI